MKITHNKVGQNLNVKDSGRAEKGEKTKENKGGAKTAASILDDNLGASKVDLSPRAQDMKKAKEAAHAAPDINEEKVARLQKMIDEGKYKVDAEDIADKMVDEHIAWS